MLNKAICIKCVNKYSEEGFRWGDDGCNDEDLWNQNIVWCPTKDEPLKKKDVLKHCKYCLEHLVIGEYKNE